MTGQQLRNSILQEAFQGHLVSNVLQPWEKTGAELLKSILAERQKKENEEKGKKAKRQTLSIIEEEPWELPDSWCWCKLGDIGSWGAGATPQRGNTSFYQGGTIPWLKTGELNNGIVCDTEEKVTTLALEKCSLRLCQPGDVLIAMYGATIGKLAIAGIPLTTNQACCACSPYNGIDNKYLFFFLLAKKEDFTKQAFGGAQPNISKEKIIHTDFPLPPLSIQKAIVKKIEKLFPLVEEYEKAAEELRYLNKVLPDKLRKSVLQEAIRGNLVPNDIPNGETTARDLLQQVLKERQEKEDKEKGKKAKRLSLSVLDDDLDELPGGWCWCKLSDLGDCLYGVSESAKTVGQYKLLRITDIQNDNVNWETVPMSDYKKKDAANYLLRPGDLVFARTGGTVGKSYLINVVPDNAIYASYLIRVRFQGKALLPKYIKYFFQSPQYWSQVIENSEGTGQPNCNGTKLANLNIPLPPLSIQHRIVEKIEDVFATIDKLQT